MQILKKPGVFIISRPVKCHEIINTWRRVASWEQKNCSDNPDHHELICPLENIDIKALTTHTAGWFHVVRPLIQMQTAFK